MRYFSLSLNYLFWWFFSSTACAFSHHTALRLSQARAAACRGMSSQPRFLPQSPLRTCSSGSSISRHMALVPLPTEELEQLLAVGAPTGEQYATYWGRTPQERYGRILESSIVSFLGVFFSYFLSFVMGGFVATILGTLFLGISPNIVLSSLKSSVNYLIEVIYF